MRRGTEGGSGPLGAGQAPARESRPAEQQVSSFSSSFFYLLAFKNISNKF
jgi:hypothetical protein